MSVDSLLVVIELIRGNIVEQCRKSGVKLTAEALRFVGEDMPFE